jgi:hypothetical protein
MVIGVALLRDWKVHPNRGKTNRVIPTTTTAVEQKQRHQLHFRRQRRFHDDPWFLTFWKTIMTMVVVKVDRMEKVNVETEIPTNANIQNYEELFEQLLPHLYYNYVGEKKE